MPKYRKVNEWRFLTWAQAEKFEDKTVNTAIVVELTPRYLKNVHTSHPVSSSSLRAWGGTPPVKTNRLIGARRHGGSDADACRVVVPVVIAADLYIADPVGSGTRAGSAVMEKDIG